MWSAAGWGLVGGSALLLGAIAALVAPITQRLIGFVMAFGGGVLISALAFELTGDALERSGAAAASAGLLAGGLAFFVCDRALDRRGGEHRKRSGGQQAAGSGTAIALGALMDGIPESAAIGVSMLEGRGVGVAFVAAVFLSNTPEAMSAATGMRAAGHPPARILGLWGGVTIASGVAAMAGYALLGGAGPDATAFVQAFAAGAILTMLADTMMPEAFEHGGSMVGLVTLLGFVAAVLLSAL